MHREILALAVPNVLTNLSVPLLGAVDTALMGRLPELAPLGAVAVGAMIFDLVYWAFGFLRMGTTGLAAQAFGAGDREELDRVLARALVVAWGGALVLWLLQRPIELLAFQVISATPAVESMARDYFRIRILAAPATLALYAYHGWFLGRQDARSPMGVVLVANLANLVLNVVLVRDYGMGVRGVAWGTVLAQYAGLVLALLLARRSTGSALPDFRRPGVFEAGALRRFAALNRDLFIRTMVLMGTFSFFTARSAAAGEQVLAANHVLLQFWHLMAYFVDGLAFAAESLCGRYAGARDEVGLRRAVSLCFTWGMAAAACFSLAYWAFGRSLLGLFTDKAALLDYAMEFQLWCVLTPVANTAAFLWDGIYIGLTASAAMRNSMLASSLLVFLPVWWLTRETLGNHGLWLALVLFMVARAASLTWMAPRILRLDPGVDDGPESDPVRS